MPEWRQGRGEAPLEEVTAAGAENESGFSGWGIELAALGLLERLRGTWDAGSWGWGTVAQGAPGD